ncbi:MAG: hypothetical protein AB9Q19_00475 [Candidatus Reddybacter sp.]
MGFLGGSNKSKQSQSTKTAGSQTQAGNAASINVSSGKKSRTNINVVSTDYGAIDRSFDFAGDASNRAFAYADSVSSRSLALVDRVSSRSAALADKSANRSLAFADKSTNRSLAFADKSAKRSLAFADKSANRSFGFANRVLSFAERTQKQLVDSVDKSAAINAKSQSASLTALASFRETVGQKPGSSTAMKSAFLLAAAAIVAPIISKKLG